MARVPISVNLQNQYDAILDAPYTLTAGVLAAGIYVPLALSQKNGSTRVQIYNAGTANYVYFRKGQYSDPVNPRGGFALAMKDTVYNIPAASTVTILLNQYERNMKNIVDNLIIDFNVGFTAGSTINIDAEQLHINDYSANTNGIGVTFQ